MIRREISAVRADGVTQNITQIHFIGWPDHGIPETQETVDDFGLMLNHFLEWCLRSKADRRAVIHCSAGIGRTGTTISLAHIIIKLCA